MMLHTNDNHILLHAANVVDHGQATWTDHKAASVGEREPETKKQCVVPTPERRRQKDAEMTELEEDGRSIDKGDSTEGKKDGDLEDDKEVRVSDRAFSMPNVTDKTFWEGEIEGQKELWDSWRDNANYLMMTRCRSTN